MKWDCTGPYGKICEVSAEEAVRFIVDNAPGFHAGTVESLAARHDKLMQIVGVMLAQSPESVQREVVAQHGYNMREAKS